MIGKQRQTPIIELYIYLTIRYLKCLAYRRIQQVVIYNKRTFFVVYNAIHWQTANFD